MAMESPMSSGDREWTEATAHVPEMSSDVADSWATLSRKVWHCWIMSIKWGTKGKTCEAMTYLYCHWPSTKRIALCNQTVMHGCSLRLAKWFVTGVPSLLKLLLTALSWETVPNRKQNTKLETSSDLFQFNIVQLLLTQSSKVVLSCRDTPIKLKDRITPHEKLTMYHKEQPRTESAQASSESAGPL